MGLFDFFKKGGVEDDSSTPEGLCPNCWGTQEYAGKVKEAIRDRQIDFNNHSGGGKAFIEQFVESHIQGIRLQKDGDGFVCPSCKGGVKSVPPKN